MKYLSFFINRLLKVVVFSLLVFSYQSTIWAEAPMIKTQAPGYYHLMIGAFEVTALYDGYVDLDTKLMKNISENELQKLSARMFLNSEKMQASVNTYLINTGSKLVLVDTGTGTLFGPNLEKTMQNLKASGYEPAQVDAIIITHMHGDHVGGMLNAEGKPAFPNAVVYVAKAESDFWLNPASEEKAPADFKKYFQMARNLATPFVKAGKWKTFKDGASPIAGIKAVSIHGHTPGHTAYEVSNGNESLLITGDMVHFTAVQFTHPEVSVGFDTSQKEAIANRLAIFKNVAERKSLIAGMHLPFPGIGHIRAESKNSYTFVPVEYSPIRESVKAKSY